MVTKKQMRAVMKKAASYRRKGLSPKKALKKAWGKVGRVYAFRNGRGKLTRKRRY